METDLQVVRVPITHPDAQALIEAVQAEYVARYGGQDESPIDPADFEDPLGRFYVGYLDDTPVATGAWRRSSVRALGAEVTAEVKRMYVVPAAQRRGVARRMLAHLEATAARGRHRGAGARDGDEAARGHRALHVLGLRTDPRLRLLLRLRAEPLLRPPALTPSRATARRSARASWNAD